MTPKKALPEDVDHFFQGESVFFQEPPPASNPQPAPQQNPNPEKQGAAAPTPSGNTGSRHTTLDVQEASQRDGMPDVMTSGYHEVDLKAWQEVIENTETQNSALRLTREERYAVEDLVNELRRQEHIKTSMNEIARLGLLLILHDFQQNRRNSLLYKVKKA